MLIFTQVLKKFSRYSTNDHEVGHKNYSFENLVDKRSIKRMISYVPNEILPMKNIGCLLISDSRIPPPPFRNDKVCVVPWNEAMETVPETYVQKLPRRVRNVKKLSRRVRNVKKRPRWVGNVMLVDLLGYRELGSLKKS